MREKSEQVVLIGSYGRKNLGDDIYLKLLLEYLSDRTVYFNCHKIDNIPKDIAIRAKHHAISTNFFEGFWRKIGILLKTRHVVYGGGELWMRLQKTPFPNLSLIKMLIMNVIFRAMGKRIYYVSVGAEKLYGISLIYAKLSARLATYIVFRDSISPAILNVHKSKYTVYPDLVLALNCKRAKRKNYVGVNFVSEVGNGFDYDMYSHAIRKFFKDSEELIVPLPAMDDREAYNNDTDAIHRILNGCRVEVKDNTYNSVDSFVSDISSAKFVVCSRLHVSLLALMLGVPTVAISYKHKVRKLFEEHGLSSMCFDPGQNMGSLDVLLKNRSDSSMDNVAKRLNKESKRTSGLYSDFFKKI